MGSSEIVFLVPAFNEARTIQKVVNSLIPHGKVLVIDDASTDNTASLAQAAGSLVVSHDRNRGYDATLNTGFAYVLDLGCALVITFDGDNQHDTASIPTFVHHLSTDVDLVLGVRKTFPRFAEYIFSLYTRFRYGLSDPLCGMKGYNTRLLKSKGEFKDCNSVGTELAIFGIKNNFSFVQIPIEIRARTDVPRFGSKISANLKILRALFKAITNRYER